VVAEAVDTVQVVVVRVVIEHQQVYHFLLQQP
jgi:hypothetical protein